jgi:hypothetical protein
VETNDSIISNQQEHSTTTGNIRHPEYFNFEYVGKTALDHNRKCHWNILSIPSPWRHTTCRLTGHERYDGNPGASQKNVVDFFCRRGGETQRLAITLSPSKAFLAFLRGASYSSLQRESIFNSDSSREKNTNTNCIIFTAEFVSVFTVTIPKRYVSSVLFRVHFLCQKLIAGKQN